MDTDLKMKCLELAVKYVTELAAMPNTKVNFPNNKVDPVKVANWFYEYCQSVDHSTNLN